MPSLCFYFQVHQPFRVRKFSYQESSRELFYFDDPRNRQIALKVAQKCYLPTNRLMLDLIHEFRGQFRIAYSITGLAIEQMWRYCPEVIESFKELAATGCVEFLGETYYHSLASLYDTEEFNSQVRQHSELTQALFNQTPRVFRNTELIFDDRIAQLIANLGFKGALAEGVDSILAGRSANEVYTAAGTNLKLLLKDYRHSDDIAFRFSNQDWVHFPLTPDKFAYFMHNMTHGSQVVNLFMDYETFGEHQWAETGIFDFMRQLPAQVLSHPAWRFRTPSEVLEHYRPVEEISFYRTTSWADLNRDLSAWQGNRMATKALDQIYVLGPQVKATNDPYLIEAWRKLLTSDHFYYMSTKAQGDGTVHAYFSPFESPYDAFIYYMNVLHDFKAQVAAAQSRPRLAESQLVIEKMRFAAANGVAPEDMPSMPEEEILEIALQ